MKPLYEGGASRFVRGPGRRAGAAMTCRMAVANDLYALNYSQPNTLYFNKANGSNPNVLARPALGGSICTTENFVTIGNSLLGVIVAMVGGLLSRHLLNQFPSGIRMARRSPRTWTAFSESFAFPRLPLRAFVAKLQQ
jgi:hypothetical protein